MPIFKSILLPVDLSEVPVYLVPFVKAMAQKFNSRVHMVFVAPRLRHYAAMYVSDPSIRRIEQEIIDGAEKRLAEIRNGPFKEVRDAVLAVLSGDAAEEIMRYAHQRKIELIMMGTHTRKGIDKAVYGSVAERVIRGAQVPVISISPSIQRGEHTELMDPYI